MFKDIFKNIIYNVINTNSLKKYNYKNISYINKSNFFSSLCKKYNSDKCTDDTGTIDKINRAAHTYGTVYYGLFNHCRNDFKLVLEVGIGSTNKDIPCNMTPNGSPGASLRVWKEFFPNAQIFGCDIDQDILFSEDRIKTFYADQLNCETIKEMWNDIHKTDFDLILDDGLHSYEANYNFFIHSYGRLKSGGVYIIEDVGNSYLKKLKSSLKDYNCEIVKLKSKFHKHLDNNLIIVRKD